MMKADSCRVGGTKDELIRIKRIRKSINLEAFSYFFGGHRHQITKWWQCCLMMGYALRFPWKGRNHFALLRIKWLDGRIQATIKFQGFHK